MDRAGRIDFAQTPMRTLLSALCAIFVVYSVLIYTTSPAHGPEASAEERTGFHVWQTHNCVSCHQLYGLGGYMGPDLTNVSSTSGEERIRTFVRYGTGRMPAHVLSDSEIDGLVAFLAWVDRSGRSKVPEEAVHWTGTYLIEPR